MSRTKDRLYIVLGYPAMVLLFVLNAGFVLAALGLFSLGIIVLPSVLLGQAGALTVTSDLGSLPLLLISGGVLLLGAGMCFGIIPVCTASYGLLKRFLRSAGIRSERLYSAGEDTENTGDETDKET